MLKEIIPSLPTRLLSCILRGGEVVVHFVFLIRSGKSFSEITVFLNFNPL